ncbi:PQQ-binding-like beta-propeller repeat protein [Actinoplanes oblitus]|uniref:PQQ-binding-like beta-propeller repeat protein n=1 Tax=Actinoplanes oblitus TaxID=3040509 RepID=A0ABY8WFZ7_9ACTN|nr:PQQ-binding-like beta-propeller repeat protein [Actinoplanes oblitus]WIM95294.1 PQQ-binding-like beta-propeller repeat protein [Actinoplanes oblitus]
MGAETVIDLGLDRGVPESYERPRRSTVPAWFAPVALVILLLAGSAASAAPPRPPFTELLRVPMGPADPYLITGGGLLVQSYGLLTAYDLGSGAARWRAGESIPVFRLRTSGGLVLMRPWSTGPVEPGTTAFSLATGAREWRNGRSVITFAGSDALLAVNGVRSLSGTGRRVQGMVDVLDPVTGMARWQVRVPSTAVVTGVPGPADTGARMLLIRDDRTAALYDLATGQPLATRVLPAATYAPDNPVVAGDVLILRHPGTDGMEVSAFDPVTLRPLWTEPADGTLEVHACGPLACFLGAEGVRAVDPATGDDRWTHRGWQGVEGRGEALLTYPDGTDTSKPAALVDPATGRTLADVTGWRPLAGLTGAGRLLVAREVHGGARTMVAVADPDVGRLRPIGELPTGVTGCEAAPSRLVCRSVSGDLVVWAYDEAAGGS